MHPVSMSRRPSNSLGFVLPIAILAILLPVAFLYAVSAGDLSKSEDQAQQLYNRGEFYDANELYNQLLNQVDQVSDLTDRQRKDKRAYYLKQVKTMADKVSRCSPSAEDRASLTKANEYLSQANYGATREITSRLKGRYPAYCPFAKEVRALNEKIPSTGRPGDPCELTQGEKDTLAKLDSAIVGEKYLEAMALHEALMTKLGNQCDTLIPMMKARGERIANKTETYKAEVGRLTAKISKIIREGEKARKVYEGRIDSMRSIIKAHEELIAELTKTISFVQDGESTQVSPQVMQKATAIFGEMVTDPQYLLRSYHDYLRSAIRRDPQFLVRNRTSLANMKSTMDSLGNALPNFVKDPAKLEAAQKEISSLQRTLDKVLAGDIDSASLAELGPIAEETSNLKFYIIIGVLILAVFLLFLRNMVLSRRASQQTFR